MAVSWQSAFYNREPDQLNLTPFEFLTSADGTPTWSDVIQKSWDGFDVYPQSCLITIPPDHDEVEASIIDAGLTGNRATNGKQHAGRKIFADISVDAPVGNLIVLFEIIENGEALFSETVYSGWIAAGNHTITTKSTIPEEVLDVGRNQHKQIKISVDPHGYLIDTNAQDNLLTKLLKR